MRRVAFPHNLMYSLVAWMLVFSLSGPHVAMATQPASATLQSSTQDTFATFLPLIFKPCQSLSISGLVTYEGRPEMLHFPLYLRFFNGAAWQTVASTTTGINPSGSYSFTNIPLLAQGQKYYVLFVNQWDTPGVRESNHLEFWATREITTNHECVIDMGTFDTQNVAQQFPYNGQTVVLPYTFTWISRTTASDTYTLALYDPIDENPFFATPRLSFTPNTVASWSLTQLPTGFVNGEWYVWEVWVYSPDGGAGLSINWGQAVRFSSTLGSSQLMMLYGTEPVRVYQDGLIEPTYRIVTFEAKSR